MAEIYCPFESLNTGTTDEPVYDRAITAEMERTFNKLRYTNGVFSSVGSALAVSANNSMTVTVGTGGAHIEGAMYFNSAPLNLAIEAADASLNRIDRVVLQFNTSVSVRSIRALIRTGTAATNPAAPELRQESNLYEIALADIYVKKGATSIAASAITDQRLNSALCGFVVAAVPSSVDTTGLFNQYQAALDEWLETVAAALDETLAGNLQNQITTLDTRLTTEESKIQPIAKGGTGATTAAGALTALGGTSISKVWTNASPASEFGKQTLALDLSAADFVDVYVDIAGDGRGRVQRFKVGEKGLITSNNDNTRYTNYCYTRLIEVTTAGITFDDGYFNSTKSNKYVKPKFIYIVKGVM